MENKNSFFDRLEPRLSPSEMTKVRGAYYLAKYGHRAQIRKEVGSDGKPLRYFEHVRRVAIILMDEAKEYNPDLICTALLHDTLEDTEDIDSAVIELFFGRDVARRVRLLTKIPADGYVERLYRADSDTVLVKMCDRLDNIRSLDVVDKKFSSKQISETWEKYIPLFENFAFSGARENILVSLKTFLVDMAG